MHLLDANTHARRLPHTNLLTYGQSMLGYCEQLAHSHKQICKCVRKYDTMPCHAMSCNDMSRPVLSCYVMSCYIMSCYVMSCSMNERHAWLLVDWLAMVLVDWFAADSLLGWLVGGWLVGSFIRCDRAPVQLTSHPHYHSFCGQHQSRAACGIRKLYKERRR